MKRPKFKPFDFRAEAKRLIRDGKMPKLKQVLDAIEEVKVHPHYVPIADFDDDAETIEARFLLTCLR